MNNILTFEDYRKMNIRQVESVIYRQFIEEIKDENEMNEGFIRNAINKASGKFIQKALADEIEKGKELEKSIKDALDGLNKGFEEIEKKLNTNTKKNSKNKLNAIEQVKEAIKAVQSQAFDTLTMIGSEGEIDFAGFMGSATVSAAANFGILFSPIRSLFITRKAYKYFLGIIRQTIRRNLLVIQLNFDQFENLILQKSFEAEGDSETNIKREALNEIIGAMTRELCGEHSKLNIIKGKTNIKNMKDYLLAFQNAQKAEREFNRNSPLRSLWEDQHNNTYTRTLEQIKQYINDDSQKELDALKNSITKMAGNDTELAQYGELLISAAEEYAIQTNHGINNNFIKMSSVFNLENQKKLIEMIQKTQEENEKEIEKKRNQKERRKERSDLKKKIKEGGKIYEEKLKDKEGDYNTFDKFNDKFSEDDVKCLKAFFASDEGKEKYKELIDKDPIYKYLIDIDTRVLNNLLESIKKLTVVEKSNVKDFTESIVKKDQALYYMMAERSIKDALNKKTSEPYFGFEGVEKAISDSDDTLESDINTILRDNLFPTASVKEKRKKRYFLTFEGSGNDLFNILHNDFKTEIFKDDKTYVDDISIENKEIIMKIIYKNLKIGNSISTQFAEYLIRLEAHMLLKSQDSYFVVENNDELKDCFTDNMSNRNAFVEIEEEDFEDIKTFLSKYHILADKDFDISSENNDKKE